MTLFSNTDKEILHIALPSIVANITVPLLGLIDVAITGHLGNAAYIAAIAVGSMIFNVIYWVFGFLRMGTSGMTAQAFGRGDTDECVRLLSRGLCVGLGVAVAALVAQRPLLGLAMAVIGVEDGLRPLVETYFSICVWGAPAMLCLYAFTGWFIGMQNTRVTMAVSIVQNIVNIVASLTLVYGFGMTIDGVATGTLIAQWSGCLMAAAVVVAAHRKSLRRLKTREVFRGEALMRFFGVNRDIFLRTLFLVAVNLFFVSAGAKQGTVVLAVNTLLMQLFTLFSYVMDGFAYAGEALCGKQTGAADRAAFRSTVSRLFAWGAALAAAYTAVYALGGTPFLSLLTDDGAVLAASAPYLPCAVAIPVAGAAAFIWDGVFIGTTDTRGMLLSSVISAFLFFAVYLISFPVLYNHGLWLAFILYLASRGVVQTAIFCRKNKRATPC